MKEKIQDQRKKAVSELSNNREEFDEEKDALLGQYVSYMTSCLTIRIQECKYENERAKKTQKAQQIELLQRFSAVSTAHESSESWSLMSDGQLHELIKINLDHQTDRIQELSTNLVTVEAKCVHVTEKLQNVRAQVSCTEFLSGEHRK